MGWLLKQNVGWVLVGCIILVARPKGVFWCINLSRGVVRLQPLMVPNYLYISDFITDNTERSNGRIRTSISLHSLLEASDPVQSRVRDAQLLWRHQSRLIKHPLLARFLLGTDGMPHPVGGVVGVACHERHSAAGRLTRWTLYRCMPSHQGRYRRSTMWWLRIRAAVEDRLVSYPDPWVWGMLDQCRIKGLMSLATASSVS